MFAGEGGPERTNRRFHYVSRGLPAKRLSTAFDSVTLYGEDPGPAARTSTARSATPASRSPASTTRRSSTRASISPIRRPRVSMTINGPAPMLLGFFLNAAIDQQCEKWIRAQGKVGRGRARRSTRSTPRAACRGRATRAPSPRATTASGSCCSASRATRCCRARPTRRSAPATLSAGARHGAGRHPQRGSGAEHLHLLDRVRAAPDGRHPAVLHRPQGPQLLLGLDLAAITSPRPARTRSRSSRSRSPTASRSSSTTCRAACTSTTSRRTCRSSSRTAWIPSTR